MSYDISLEIDTGGPELATVYEVGNYTYNVSGMYREALGFGLPDLHGKTCGDYLLVLCGAVEEMRNNPDKYRVMNPPNGWGNYEGAFDYLWQLYEGCCKHPKATIRVA